jgi:steroid 5-alpha reductase family enzyme
MSQIPIDSFGFVSLFVFCYMTAWFFTALILRRNDVADIAWGIGFVLVAVSLFIKYGIAFDRGFLAGNKTCISYF